MVKVNYDSATGKILGYYPDFISYTSIPTPYIEIDDTLYQDCIAKSGLVKVDLITLKIINITNVLCYYNYGFSNKTVTSDYVAQAGEVIFTTTPTTSELKTSFPSTASSIPFIITKNAVAADTISVQGIKLTAGADFEVGTDIATTTKNISTALNLIANFTMYWTSSYSDATVIITEKISGNQNVPVNITTTGTITVTNGTIVSSVYGYENAYVYQQLRALTATYVVKLTGIKRALLDAYTLENTATVTSLKTLRTNVISEYNTKAKAIING